MKGWDGKINGEGLVVPRCKGGGGTKRAGRGQRGMQLRLHVSDRHVSIFRDIQTSDILQASVDVDIWPHTCPNTSSYVYALIAQAETQLRIKPPLFPVPSLSGVLQVWCSRSSSSFGLLDIWSQSHFVP